MSGETWPLISSVFCMIAILHCYSHCSCQHSEYSEEEFHSIILIVKVKQSTEQEGSVVHIRIWFQTESLQSDYIIFVAIPCSIKELSLISIAVHDCYQTLLLLLLLPDIIISMTVTRVATSVTGCVSKNVHQLFVLQINTNYGKCTLK